MDTDMRDAVEAGFVEAYKERADAEAHARTFPTYKVAREWLAEAERKLDLSREQVKVLWS